MAKVLRGIVTKPTKRYTGHTHTVRHEPGTLVFRSPVLTRITMEKNDRIQRRLDAIHDLFGIWADKDTSEFDKR